MTLQAMEIVVAEECVIASANFAKIGTKNVIYSMIENHFLNDPVKRTYSRIAISNCSVNAKPASVS